jgi:hypothetical protein
MMAGGGINIVHRRNFASRLRTRILRLCGVRCVVENRDKTVRWRQFIARAALMAARAAKAVSALMASRIASPHLASASAPLRTGRYRAPLADGSARTAHADEISHAASHDISRTSRKGWLTSASLRGGYKTGVWRRSVTSPAGEILMTY